ncbi:DNRLRE domain-containing protein [Sorangium sp. So ce429]
MGVRIRALDAAMMLVAVLVLAACSSPEAERTDASHAVSAAAQPLATDGQVCISIQRGTLGDTSDATVWQSSPTWNDGRSALVYAGFGASGGRRRALLRHDLGLIPAGATLNSASLVVYQRYRTTESLVEVRRITAPWEESSVTWNRFGESFDPAPVGSFVVTGGGTSGFRTLDIKPLAQGWVSGTSPNHGVMLDDPTASTYTEFPSAESSPVDRRPRLDVCYVTCSDGIKNGAETGVDCGGPSCPSCCQPSAEACDGVDNDCDGQVDEGFCGTPPDACHGAGVCDPATGGCTFPAATDGTACSDGNACTQVDSCRGGACVGASPVACAASDACHLAGTCDPATGACSNPAAPDGAACSDGNACTLVDSCLNGACAGASPVACAPAAPCRLAGVCDPATGACGAGPASPDGTACEDGNACTQGDRCEAGGCVAGTELTCPAGGACRGGGACDPATGACGAGPARPDGTSCDDVNAATEFDTCRDGTCVGADSVRVVIASPVDGAIIMTDSVQVTGTLSEPATVRIGELEATGTGLSFSFTVPLHEGSNVIAVQATSTGTGAPGSASVVVERDRTPPRVAITSPVDRALIGSNAATVTGTVDDLVVGTVTRGDCSVVVNGVTAEVENGSFRAANVPVDQGNGTITAVATDVAGNTASAVIEVTGSLAANAIISTAGGDGQAGVVQSALAEPLIAQVLDNTGQPVPGVEVTFRVTRSNGFLANGERLETVISDELGRAPTTLTLGNTAGEASDQVTATAPKFLGTATFAARGVPDPDGERVLTLASGGNQKGMPNALAPLPLVVFLSDGNGNAMAHQDVTFTVGQGGGRVNGASSVITGTDADGRAFVLFTMGPDAGEGSQLVEATAAGASPVQFIGSVLERGDPANTRLTGLVLTNENLPIVNALLRVEDMDVEGRTNDEGRFELTVPLPAGIQGYKRVHLNIENRQTGAVPAHLEFEVDLIPGAENPMDRPFYLPIVGSDGVGVANPTTEVVLRRADTPGFTLTIPAGSATFVLEESCASDAECIGGATCVSGHCRSKTGNVQVITVHNDKIPMPPSNGSRPNFALAIMPHTVHFDPPALLTIPKADGRAPGEVVQFFSYDHDLGIFVVVGTATVSEDGREITSKIIKGGWHYPTPTPAPGTCVTARCRASVCTDCGSPICPASYVRQAVQCWRCNLDDSGKISSCCGIAGNNPRCCPRELNGGDGFDCADGSLTPPPYSFDTTGYSPDYECYGSSVANQCVNFSTCSGVARREGAQPDCVRGYDVDPELRELSLSFKAGRCVDTVVDDRDPPPTSGPDTRHAPICCPIGNICCADKPNCDTSPGSTDGLVCCPGTCRSDKTCASE